MPETPSRIPRAAVRHPITVPITTELGDGVTQDISTAGVYFTCKGGFVVGARLTFSVELDASEGEVPLRLRCSGTVVRIDARDDEVGVAAKISTYSIER